MFNIRRMEPKDLIDIQKCNQYNLPENYPMTFWLYSVVTWPEASFLAEDSRGKIVGYVLASVEQAEDNDSTWVGHINSLGVLRTYRRLGLAKRLMTLSKDSMMDAYPLQYIQLQVRTSNRAALSLYRDALGYTVYSVDHTYYADGEDAFSMRLWINGVPHTPRPRCSELYINLWCENITNLSIVSAEHVHYRKDQKPDILCIDSLPEYRNYASLPPCINKLQRQGICTL